jgi:hypothetical protein
MSLVVFWPRAQLPLMPKDAPYESGRLSLCRCTLKCFHLQKADAVKNFASSKGDLASQHVPVVPGSVQWFVQLV